MKQLSIAYVEEVMALIQSLPDIASGQEESEESRRNKTKLIRALNRCICEYDVPLGRWIFPTRTSHDLSRDWVRGEADSIERVVELANMGVLAQVQKCACGDYFFVRFPNREPKERFHSDKCRVEFWEKSPDRKKQKRDKAKENYWRQKDKESSYLHKQKRTK